MVLPIISKKMYTSDLRQGIKGNISTLSEGKWQKSRKRWFWFVKYLTFKCKFSISSFFSNFLFFFSEEEIYLLFWTVCLPLAIHGRTKINIKCQRCSVKMLKTRKQTNKCTNKYLSLRCVICHWLSM